MFKSYVSFYPHGENANTNANSRVSRFSPDAFQTSCLRVSKIWNMLRQAYYLDDLLIITNISFKDHLLKLEMVLARFSISGMRMDISKSKFFAEQIEYLECWIAQQGIQPIRNKVEMNAILDTKAAKTRNVQ
jgi:hypothetical protein